MWKKGYNKVGWRDKSCKYCIDTVRAYTRQKNIHQNSISYQ